MHFVNSICPRDALRPSPFDFPTSYRFAWSHNKATIGAMRAMPSTGGKAAASIDNAAAGPRAKKRGRRVARSGKLKMAFFDYGKSTERFSKG